MNHFWESRRQSYDQINKKFTKLGSFLNPIPLKLFEETSIHLKIKFGIYEFDDYIKSSIMEIPKSATVGEVEQLIADNFVFEKVEVVMYDLFRNQMDKNIQIDELPENNDCFIEFKILETALNFKNNTRLLEI